jgi:hypothetical protein
MQDIRMSRTLCAEPSDEFRYSNPNRLYKYWLEKRGNHARPKWSDINLMDLYDVVPCICVRDVPKDGGDFVCRFWGTTLSEFYGVDCTGKQIAETYSPGGAERTRTIYNAVLNTGCPVRVIGNLGYVDKSELKFFEGIFLAVDGDDGSIRHVIGCFEFVSELSDADRRKLAGKDTDVPGLLRWTQAG